ncbi:hypothetical protein BD560DRAFT_32132 [Blakeslea trispora]|nr:hypothetical protein BD560DRAFT_32132 [Blakeslea trispora]
MIDGNNNLYWLTVPSSITFYWRRSPPDTAPLFTSKRYLLYILLLFLFVTSLSIFPLEKMLNLNEALNEYLCNNENATLSEFVYSNVALFSSHDYENKEKMKIKLQESFIKVYKQHYLDKTPPSTSLPNTLCADLFNYNKKSPADIRNKIFQWFYCLSESRHEDFTSADKVILEDFLSCSGSHPRILLDKMAIKMLKNFEQLTPSDLNILKLAMSYIVNLNGNEDVYRQYIEQSLFWEIVDRCPAFANNYIEEQEVSAISALCKRAIEAAKKSLSAGLLFVLEEQAKLLKEDKMESNEYHVLQAFNYLLNNFKTWKKTKRESEAQKVCRVYDLVNIFFEDSPLKVKIGETVGRTTKEVCMLNEFNFSGGTSSRYNSGSSSASSVAAAAAVLSSSSSSLANPSSGRKIDFAVTDDKDNELSFCEFKATNTKSLSQYQQSKTFRLNCTIAEEMLKLYGDEYVVFFVWTGDFGEFCSLKEHEGVFVSRFVEPFIVPTEIVELDDDFSKTLTMIIRWKEHLLLLSEQTKKAKKKPRRRQREYPSVCFTAVKQKKRRMNE